MGKNMGVDRLVVMLIAVGILWIGVWLRGRYEGTKLGALGTALLFVADLAGLWILGPFIPLPDDNYRP